jgi:hypothetical protein
MLRISMASIKPENIPAYISNHSDKLWLEIVNGIVDSTIQRVKLHPVRLELLVDTGEFDTEEMFDRISSVTEDHIDDEDMEKFLSTITFDTIIFKQKHMHIYSTKTGNSDNRGGGCGDFGFGKDDFKLDIENENGITLLDLVKSVYRLKGSKYDFHYEMFSSIKIVKCDDSNIKVRVMFDYGS